MTSNDDADLVPLEAAAPPTYDDEKARGRRLNSFYCRLRLTGAFADKPSARLYRAFVADDALLLVDIKMTTLDPDVAARRAARVGRVAGAAAGGLAGKAVGAMAGAAAAANVAARKGKIEAALDQADERAVRKYVAADPTSRAVPAAAFRAARLGPVSDWWKLWHRDRAGVAAAVLAEPAGRVRGLVVPDLTDIGLIIGALTALSGDTL